FVFINNEGQVTRTFQWVEGTASLIFNEITKRVEVADPAKLTRDGIPHQVLAKISRTQVMKAPVKIGEYGTLSYVSEIESLQPSLHFQDEDPNQFKGILKKSAAVHAAVLAFIFLLGFVLYPLLKEEQQIVEVVKQVRLEPKPE